MGHFFWASPYRNSKIESIGWYAAAAANQIRGLADAQVETRLLEAIRQQGIFPARKQTSVRQKQRQDPKKGSCR